MDVSIQNIGGSVKTYKNGSLTDNSIEIDWLDSSFKSPKDPRKLKENRLIEIPSDEVSDEDAEFLIELQTSDGSIISKDIENTLVVPRLFVNGEERKIDSNFKWLIDGVDQRLNRPFININKQYFSNNGDIIQLTFIYHDDVEGTSVMQRVDNFHGNRETSNGNDNEDNLDDRDTERDNELDFSEGYKSFDGYDIPIEATQLWNEPKNMSTHQNFWNLKFYRGTEKRTTYFFDDTFFSEQDKEHKFEFDFQYLGDENINGIRFRVSVFYSDNVAGEISDNSTFAFNENEFSWNKVSILSESFDFQDWLIDIPILSKGNNNYSLNIPQINKSTNVWMIIEHPFKNTDTDSFISFRKIRLINE